MSAAPDVLVVGCGAQGLSTALHLARLGVRVVAVDRAAPGSQTSARAAGQSVLAQTEPACGELMRRTVDKLLRFEEEHGVPLTVHQVGSVKLALSDWAAAQLEREVERATAIGARMAMVDVATVAVARAAHRRVGRRRRVALAGRLLLAAAGDARRAPRRGAAGRGRRPERRRRAGDHRGRRPHRRSRDERRPAPRRAAWS